MARYVLVHRHSEPNPDDLDFIAQARGVKVLDRTLKRAMLVEAPEETVAELRSRLKNWIVAEEADYPRPGPAREAIEGNEEA